MVISCDRVFGPCPQGIMHMRQSYNLVNWCKVIMTPTQQLKTMDQAERTQESECGSRARAEETPEQRAQRLARQREQYRERRARATARVFLRLARRSLSCPLCLADLSSLCSGVPPGD